jgi:hypothetical protein
MSPHIKNSDFGLYKYIRVASSLSINWLKFAEGTLYKAKIPMLDDLVSSSIHELSKSALHSEVRYQFF